MGWPLTLSKLPCQFLYVTTTTISWYLTYNFLCLVLTVAWAQQLGSLTSGWHLPASTWTRTCPWNRTPHQHCLQTRPRCTDPSYLWPCYSAHPPSSTQPHTGTQHLCILYTVYAIVTRHEDSVWSIHTIGVGSAKPKAILLFIDSAYICPFVCEFYKWYYTKLRIPILN